MAKVENEEYCFIVMHFEIPNKITNSPIEMGSREIF